MAGYSKFQKAIAHYSIASVGLIRCWFATLFKRAHNVYFISVGSIDIIECSPLVPRTHRMFQPVRISAEAYEPVPPISCPLMLPQYLVRFLRDILRFLTSISKHRPTSLLLAFLAFLRRQLFRQNTTTARPAPFHRQVQCLHPSTTQNDSEKAICAMTAPNHKFAEPQHGGRSPVDAPYDMSSSGHLIPYSPAPSRRYTREHISWMSGSQASLHEEPSPIDSGSTHPYIHSVVRSISPGHKQSSNHPNQGARTPSPLQSTPAFPPSLPEPFSDSPIGRTPPALGVHGLHGGAPRSQSPMSTSQQSVSRRSMRSHNSALSIGRASYREHRGPPPRARTPNPSTGSPLVTGSSVTLGRAAPDGSSATPGHLIALPNADDPNRPGEPTVDYEGPRFAPMSTHGVLRYHRHKQPNVIRRPTEPDHTINAMLYEFPETQGSIPPGWTAHRHPEGALYFMHVESKTFTEVNVCNVDIYEDIEYFKGFLFSELQDEIEKRHLSGSLKHDEIQLVLEPKIDEGGLLCSYYFVNPGSRCLFWLDDWEGEDIFSDCRGDLSLPHKGLGIQSHYWRHWDLFPNLCHITQELKDEVVDMILHATSDHLTSNRSSCPLNVEELNHHLSLIEKINPESTYRRGHPAIVIGRIMHTFYHAYFLNFHGEECARLNFDQTVHGWRYHPSWLMTACAPLLFMAPVTSVRSLHRIFVDEIASKDKWNMYINKLNSQLQDTNLLATVLLNANVGFLAIQSVDNGAGTSLRQLASYMSLVASMASIILGLVFVGHHRTESRNTAFEAAKFLFRLRHKRHGLETLGIIYSLPYAFLMWAMVLFFIAFVSEWCGPGDISSWTSVGSFMFLVTLLVAWCIWTSREQTGYWWFQPDPDQVELQDLEEDDKMSFTTTSGFLRRLIPPSCIRKQTGPEPPPESHAMQDTTRPQNVPHSSDSTLHEDSSASEPVNITVHQATLLSASSTLNEDAFERQTSPV